MNYSQELFEKYRTTHVIPRDGEGGRSRFLAEAKMWESVFARFLPERRDAIIMDLGCGSGSLLHWIQSKGYTEAHGIDLSPEEVQTAQKLQVKNVRIGQLEDVLAEAQPRYDLIILRDVLEHLPKQVAFDVLKGIFRVLKPGGRLLLQVPNGASPFFGRTFYGDFTHEWAYTTLSISQLAHALEYRILGCFPYHPCSGSLTSRLKGGVIWLVEATIRLYIRIEMGDRQAVVSQVLVAVLEKSGASGR